MLAGERMRVFVYGHKCGDSYVEKKGREQKGYEE
jgi:hypothetical protein